MISCSEETNNTAAPALCPRDNSCLFAFVKGADGKVGLYLNLLVNALNEREHVRIARDYPPDSGYSSKQIEYDKSFQASGLFGPIVLKAIVR